ncbi:molybdenum ABC transporter permease [Methylacidiphilum kamchatkense Kam1]|uniref:Molybdenum transport system permease n=1 Tax=Methylacidiphilum kamchatkense Kam1 TaxID=1202785 RepID=A0A0C1UPN2_9BACT|nr:molybdate ABC transporter permease subunit [Methylacidiphilum kamchatkense]KIE58354.1 molybdenum ABC transporter permease [Methylacidiphilum kamchatkense Kam1]QDQ42241.1 molybdate transport system permease protein [Methylacidiphilum kamchatkense Kam1]
MDWIALWLSLKLAFWTTICLYLLGIPLAYWLSFGKKRQWKILVDSMVSLPLVLPPTVLGFYLLILFGNSGIGTVYSRLFGKSLVFSFEGLLIASIIYSLPFMVQNLAGAFSLVDSKLIEASLCCGESPWNTFFKVIFPLSLQGFLRGTVLSFTHTLGEFGIVLMVGGDIPGKTRTISIALYDQVEGLNYQEANTTALVLLLFSFFVLFLVYSTSNSQWKRKNIFV